MNGSPYWVAKIGSQVIRAAAVTTATAEYTRDTLGESYRGIRFGGEGVAFSEGRPTGSARLFLAQNNHCYAWWRSACRSGTCRAASVAALPAWRRGLSLRHDIC